MKKLLIAGSACLCLLSNAAFADMTVTNNCNRYVHITAEGGTSWAGVSLDVGQTGTLKVDAGNSYHVQVFEGYFPIVPYDWRTGVAHDATFDIVANGPLCKVDVDNMK